MYAISTFDARIVPDLNPHFIGIPHIGTRTRVQPEGLPAGHIAKPLLEERTFLLPACNRVDGGLIILEGSVDKVVGRLPR